MTKLTIQNNATGTQAAKAESPDLSSLLSEGNGFSAEQIEMLKAAMANQVTEAMKKQTKKERKTRKAKDPNAPKKPATAYMAWLNQSRAQIIEDHFTNGDGECTLEGRAKVTEVAKKAGELWKGLSDEDKQPFEEEAAKAKEAWTAAKAEYQASEPQPVEDPEDLPEAPEGWSGPYENHYLWKIAVNADGETMRKSYPRFADAVTAAQELGPTLCGGITRNNGKYTLRRAGMGGPYYTDKAQVSWVFGEATMVVVKPKGESEAAPKKEAPKKEAAKKAAPKKAANKKAATKKKVTLQVDEPEAQPEPQPEAQDEHEVEVDVVDNTGSNLDDGAYDGPTDDEEDPTAGDSDEEDLQVEVEEVDGVEYLVNSQNGEVYDYTIYQESEQVVKIGTWDGSTLTLD